MGSARQTYDGAPSEQNGAIFKISPLNAVVSNSIMSDESREQVETTVQTHDPTMAAPSHYNSGGPEFKIFESKNDHELTNSQLNHEMRTSQSSNRDTEAIARQLGLELEKSAAQYDRGSDVNALRNDSDSESGHFDRIG